MKVSLKFLSILIMPLVVIWGCAPPPPAEGTPEITQGQFIFQTVWFILVAVLAYYWLVVKPQISREEKQKKFVDELKKGDEVITSGGLLGKVVSTKPDSVTVDLGQNTRVRVDPNHVHALKKTDSSAEASSNGKKAETQSEK